MEAILTRAGDAVATSAPQVAAVAGRSTIGHRLAALAQAVAERVVSRHREASPEWFRFPLP